MAGMDHAQVHHFLDEFATAVGLRTETGTGTDRADAPADVVLTSTDGALPSVFAVSEFATASVACAGLATARLASLHGAPIEPVIVDGRLASWWFVASLRPDGWERGGMWDSIAGIYRTAEGWIRLHTNAPHHRAAAVAVLGCEPEREAVARAVGRWSGDDLEQAIVEASGCAAVLRSEAAWAMHPQGVAVAAEPLVGVSTSPDRVGPPARALSTARSTRPLAGVRVLDLTRVLAGPVATRHLAGLGADVLRIDPPWWDEPAVASEVALGKRCARLDLRQADHRRQLRGLLAEADICVHGYRSDALARLGLGAAERAALAPGLVDVSLDAYGWSGPWAGRRGFDSLVQLSTGIAHAPMALGATEEPSPLPAQALDHATGYLMAAAAIKGWCDRLEHGTGSQARLSLARTARSLTDGPRTEPGTSLAPPADVDHQRLPEATSWGPGHRLLPPVRAGRAELRWDRPATALGSEPDAAWLPPPEAR